MGKLQKTHAGLAHDILQLEGLCGDETPVLIRRDEEVLQTLNTAAGMLRTGITSGQEKHGFAPP